MERGHFPTLDVNDNQEPRIVHVLIGWRKRKPNKAQLMRDNIGIDDGPSPKIETHLKPKALEKALQSWCDDEAMTPNGYEFDLEGLCIDEGLFLESFTIFEYFLKNAHVSSSMQEFDVGMTSMKFRNMSEWMMDSNMILTLPVVFKASNS